jgi:ABC-type sugar transport system permease subunit
MDSPALFIIPIFIILAVVSLVWHFSRSSSLLDNWAEARHCSEDIGLLYQAALALWSVLVVAARPRA